MAQSLCGALTFDFRVQNAVSASSADSHRRTAVLASPITKGGSGTRDFIFGTISSKCGKEKITSEVSRKSYQTKTDKEQRPQNTPFLISLQAFTFLHLHCDAIAASLHHFLRKLVHGLSASNFYELLLLLHFLHCYQR